MKQYLLRLDDASPYMDSTRWNRMCSLINAYGVKPLVGIIPANADPQTMIEPCYPRFWDTAQLWAGNGWDIALHGYDHVCTSNKGLDGLNPFWKRSEFAGLALDAQREKISKGYSILTEHGLKPKYFFAPSHTFDRNTIEALRLETDIRTVSDSIAFRPYTDDGFLFIPQISGHCYTVPTAGIYTFCLHPNTMGDGQFSLLETFLDRYAHAFTTPDSLAARSWKPLTAPDRLLRKAFFTYRKLRGLK